MTTLSVKPRNKKELIVFKRVLKALDADFETLNSDESPYSAEFTASILQARKDSASGKGVKIELADLWK
jgi:hypothetical protein